MLPPHQTNPGPGEVAFRRYQEVAELYISASLLLLTWLRLQATPRAESEDGMWSRRRLRARQTSAQR